ncbi:hypothetical protein ABZZ79_12675 [Streptomyces sp. NPDC006458]|uniref:hypothetical protein n=1 Tax=Streptomyces sp. NPDC006458 TaxID=3154302 RepID=UPI0033B646AD
MSLGDEHETAGGYAGTRTRLPEDTSSGGPRRRASSSRSLITVVAVVVLLIAAIAFANRGGDDSSSDEGSGGGGGKGPEASETAATGTKPVGTGSGGIPSGFAHDQQGAESAAANYAVTLVSADILKPTRRSEIVRQLFVSDEQAALEQQLDQAYTEEFLNNIGLDKNGNSKDAQTYVSRTVPIGTKATSYSDTAASIEVWCTGVFGTAGETSTNPVTSDWFTMTLQLRWADGDWKVDSFAQKDGPAPVPGDDKASSADEMAKAVEENGGFSYAR